jgi:hypothetical protein
VDAHRNLTTAFRQRSTLGDGCGTINETETIFMQGKMKTIIKGVVTIGALSLLTGCASGKVYDKRAPGDLGHKTYQLQLVDRGVLEPGDLWVTVTEKQWDDCGMDERYPKCAVDDRSPRE